MGAISDNIKALKCVIRLTGPMRKLCEPMNRLVAEGKLPPSMVQNWELSNPENTNGHTLPKGQPPISANTTWFMIDLAHQLEEHAHLFDEPTRDAIAEYVGVMDAMEEMFAQGYDSRMLAKWERKHGTYEGPTEREIYRAKLGDPADEAAADGPEPKETPDAAGSAIAEPADDKPAATE